MLGKIKYRKDIRKAIQYNELKVQRNEASFLYSDNFLKNTEELTFEDKLDRFEQRIALNERSKSNALQIHLDFDPSDHPDKNKLIAITQKFMQGIDMGKQPYLAYQHHDTAHPHVHVVSVGILEDGSKKFFYRADIYKIHKLTRDLEDHFGLRKLPLSKHYRQGQFETQKAQKVIHGDSSLKRAISDVLNTVIGQYQYTNFQELNAVLRLYNVQASRGNEKSWQYRHRGVIYHATDMQGNRIGKGIKASVFQLRPTLDRLEEQFERNLALRQDNLPKIRASIQWSLTGPQNTWDEFKRERAGEGIHAIEHTEKKGGSPEIYFIDPSTKCVISGQGLGEQYSLTSLKEKYKKQEDPLEQEHTEELHLRHHLRHGL